MHVQRLKRLLEFFVIGVVFGVTEDLLAVMIATDADITVEVIVVVVVIAIPFAVISELVVDHPQFLHFDWLAVHLKRAISPQPSESVHLLPRMYWDGKRNYVISPEHHRHRCNLCGRDFDTGGQLREHVERQHPKRDVQWWVVAEDPDRDLQFFGE